MEQDARDKLARECMPLVEYLVSSERRKLGLHLDRDELRSFAMEGLAAALDNYDPERVKVFKSYARLRIRGAIYDGLCQLGWFPRRLRRRINFYRRSEEMLRYYSETPPPKDKVEAVHRLADTLKELATAYVTTYTVEDCQEPAPQPAEAEFNLERKRLNMQLNYCIDSLPPKQQQVVRNYFFENLNLPEVAERMNISKSWASKLLGAALASLRKSFDEAPPSLESFQPPVR